MENPAYAEAAARAALVAGELFWGVAQKVRLGHLQVPGLRVHGGMVARGREQGTEACSRPEGGALGGATRATGDVASDAADHATDGQASSSAHVVRLFSSLALRYLHDKMSGLEGMGPFVHPALATLRAYDAANRTSLCDTLRVYLERDRNVTEAAGALFVHRNTLLKRLRKIRSLTSIDLDDAACRKRLLVSFLVQGNV